MSKRNDKLLVLDILDALNKISNYTHGLSYKNFASDSKTVDAVTRNIEIIGEASKHLSKKFKDKIDLPWPRIIGMRNIIVHEYFGVDTKIIWKIVTEQIESLKDVFEKSTEELN